MSLLEQIQQHTGLGLTSLDLQRTLSRRLQGVTTTLIINKAFAKGTSTFCESYNGGKLKCSHYRFPKCKRINVGQCYRAFLKLVDVNTMGHQNILANYPLFCLPVLSARLRTCRLEFYGLATRTLAK